MLASTTIEGDLTALEPVSRRLNLLLAAAYARAQRQGTLVEGLQFDAASFKQLARELSERQPGQVAQLDALAINSASTADPIAVKLRWLTAPAPPPSGPGPRRP